MLSQYLKVQSFALLCGAVGPLFMILYFASGRDPFLVWFFWSGLAVTALTVVYSVTVVMKGQRTATRIAGLEKTGVLALAEVTGIEETGTYINERPLLKLELNFSGPGLEPFVSRTRVTASPVQLQMITNRNLAALVDPATKKFDIDWQRSALLTGVMPAEFTLLDDDRTFDLSGHIEPLMDVLRILMSHGIALTDEGALRANPAARQQIRDHIKRVAVQYPSVVRGAQPEPARTAAVSTAQRLHELEALRSAGDVSEEEYAAKRERIIADL
ncbi:hypothetical protein SAMN04489835_1113 [Mycolicibacterium rutilum]|uniref:Short C-terminal domain-containing protein n=1 Tax=Mycolicibacterium rutilum TaxID=370526 RepID=A0A1H6J3L0_MYCRU|nr:SHOCT domain-containing protein [Mycolicibacterium rutilum]SEH53520.1 hypothetical protein SAMN04489835_1113 [Mycolicibacterium rutilum]